MKAPLDTVVVGLGHQSLEDHLPAISQISSLKLVGVIDLNINLAKKIGKQYGVVYASSVSSMLKKIEKPELAVVAVPHFAYLQIINDLAEKGIHIIKEKPFALTVEEANKLIGISKDKEIFIQVTMQRRFNPIFIHFCQLINRIGNIYSIEARYTMNISNLGEGWRSKAATAGGGALIDMGYHYIDLFVWYFGLPLKVRCRLSTRNRVDQDYDVEDTAFVDMTYKIGDKEILASLIISRAYPQKDEGLTAYGTKGSVSVQRGKLIRLDSEGEVVEELERLGGWPSALMDQLEEFAKNIRLGRKKSLKDLYGRQTALLAACYDSAKLDKEVFTADYLGEIING